MATATAITVNQRVPHGWQLVRLGDVAEVGTGGTPSRSEPSYWGGEIPWMASGEINLRRVRATAEQITTEGLKNSNARVLPPGTVMVAMNGQGATRGKVCVLDLEATCNQSLAAIRSGQLSDNRFLFHVLDSSYEELRGLTGDGRSGLNLGIIRTLPVLLPPLPEQRAIAAVLDSIDDAIESAEEVIAATEQLRDSLLHDLLTRGLPGKHTEFRDVPGLGIIPADWEVVRLGDVIPKFEYGTSVKSHVDPFGSPVLRIPNIARGELDLRDLKYADLSPSELEALELCTGDILLVRTNGNPEICGRCWVVDGLEGRWAFASYIVRGRPDQSRVNPKFAGYFLTSETGRRLLRGHIRTSAGNYNLSVGDLGSISLLCPTLIEQETIVSTVEGLTQSIAVAREERDRLRLLKESTAVALLTGQVRIEYSEA